LDIERIPAKRDVVEVLRARLDLLGGEDRVLLKMYLDAGSSFDEIAKLTGMNRSSVCRRIHRMIYRLYDETYVRCEADRASFSAPELAVVRDHLVRGLSLKQICRDHNLCYYRARTIVQKARRFAREMETR
jgi:DNA-directed RNA polymerase specialized sigma24 family protein